VIQNNVQAAELNFTSNGDKLTLTSVNGGSQTITVLPGAAAGQSFNFDQMGISFSVTDISSPIKTAAEIASYFGSIRVSSGDIKSGATLPANLPTQSISNMVVQGSVKAGTYTFSATGANLTLSNGSGSSQTITVLPGASGGQTFNFNELGISFQNLYVIEPLGYLQFNYLVENAIAVVTDSGGITEETTVMGVPCMTLRDNTERPETVEIGTNELIGTNPNAIKPTMEKLFSGKWKKGAIPKFWDGKAAERIVNNLLSI
jgi:hypothetical protein